MSTYSNRSATELLKSPMTVAGAALALALLSACGSNDSEYKGSEFNADADIAAADEALMTDMNAAEIDMEATANLLEEAAAAPPEPTCASMPSNGALLADHRTRAKSGHVLEIDNGTRGDAIIKVRNADTDKTLASFFVARNSTANLQRIPDGSYSIQYMIGDKLAEDCRTFIKDGTASANEFPGPDTLTTESEKLADRTRVSRSKLSYTLYAVPHGNVVPNYVSSAEFDKP